MGLDASVMCNCFRDGRTTDPPFPRDWLCVDEEGFLALTPEHDTSDRFDTLLRWTKSCCEHEWMHYVNERISNWPGVRLFQEALADLGWEHFPVLRKELPDANGGMVEPASCRLALEELARFEESGVIGQKTVLADTSTGEPVLEHAVRTHDAAREMIHIYTERRYVALSAFDLVLIDPSTRKPLFRCRRLRQFKRNGRNITGKEKYVSWEDLDTGRRCETALAIGIWWPRPGCPTEFEKLYPSELHVETRQRSAKDFEYIVSALEKVFTASVAIGNPVRWC